MPRGLQRFPARGFPFRPDIHAVLVPLAPQARSRRDPGARRADTAKRGPEQGGGSGDGERSGHPGLREYRVPVGTTVAALPYSG